MSGKSSLAGKRKACGNAARSGPRHVPRVSSSSPGEDGTPLSRCLPPRSCLRLPGS